MTEDLGGTAESQLQYHIDWYVQQGYRVISQTETSAQLVKPKEFSFVWALFWFLIFGVGVLVYVFYYAAKKDATLYLTVAPDGTVTRTVGASGHAL